MAEPIDLSFRMTHRSPVMAMAVLRDGTLASAAEDGSLRLWDPATGQLQRELTGNAEVISALATLADGTLASASNDGTICLWDAASGRRQRKIASRTRSALTLASLPDGALASAGDGRTIRLWDPSAGQIKHELTHTESISALSSLPDGTLVSADVGGAIAFWDPRTGEVQRRLVGHIQPVQALAAVLDGILASAANDGTIHLWNTTNGQLQRELRGHIGAVIVLSTLPDGTLASAGTDGIIRLWNTANGQLQRELTGHTRSIQALASLPDGALASADIDGAIRLWNTTNGQLQRELTGHSSKVWALATLADGSVASAGQGETIRFWNRTGRLRGEVSGRGGTILTLATLRDGTLVSAGTHGTIRLLDPVTGQIKRVLDGHISGVWTLASLPNGAFVSASNNGTIYIWDPATGELRRELRGHIRSVQALATLPDGTLASGGTDGTVRLWDPTTGRLQKQLTGHAGSIRALITLPGGALASASADGTVRIWDPAAGELRRQLDHGDGVWALAPLPDGTLASASGMTIHLWDPSTGKIRRDLTGHTGTIRALATLPDSTLISASHDGTIRFWDPTSGREVEPFHGTTSGQRALGITDEASTVDWLGFAPDVQRLLHLLISMSTRPPLAVALLGEWGGGKSSFMEQLYQQISELPQGEAISRMEQVRFNAWHYSDDSVLHGMVTEVYRELATNSSPATPDPLEVAAARDALKKVEGELEQAEHDLAAEEREVERLREREVERSDEADKDDQGPSMFILLVLMVGGFVVAGTSLISSGDIFDWLKRVVAALGATIGLLAMMWAKLKDVGAKAKEVETQAKEVATTVKGVGAQAKGFWATAKKVLAKRRAKPTTSKSNAAPHLEVAVQRRDRLQQTVDELVEKSAAAKEEILKVDPVEAFQQMIEDPVTKEVRRRHQGLVGDLRDQLREFSDRLAMISSGSPIDTRQILLYVDDLDRCAPSRVVEVLEAVNLLHATKLFMVVVGVDARWLHASLEHHHGNIFGHGSVTDSVYDQIGTEIGDPLDYLDKIFQIPFALPPMTAHDSAGLLRHLIADSSLAAPPAEGGDAEHSVDAGAAVDDSTSVQPNRAEPDTQASDRTTAASVSGEASKADHQVIAHVQQGAGSDAVRSDVGPTTEMTSSDTQLVRSLIPAPVQLSEDEQDFLAIAAGFASTPRAVKKLLNLYQLLRVGISQNATDLDNERLLPAALLLGLVVGAPQQAELLLPKLIAPETAANLETLLNSLRDAHINTDAAEPQRPHPYCDTCSDWERILSVLPAAFERHPPLANATAYAFTVGDIPLAVEVARYSFHTEHLWRRYNRTAPVRS